MSDYLDARLDAAQETLDEMMEFSLNLDKAAEDGRRPGRTVAAMRDRARRIRMLLHGMSGETEEQRRRADAISADAAVLYESVNPDARKKAARRTTKRTAATTTTTQVEADLARRVLVLEQHVDALSKLATQQAGVIKLLCARSVRPDVAGAWARVMSGLPHSGDHQAVYDWLTAIRMSGEDRGNVYKEALDVSR